MPRTDTTLLIGVTTTIFFQMLAVIYGQVQVVLGFWGQQSRSTAPSPTSRMSGHDIAHSGSGTSKKSHESGTPSGIAPRAKSSEISRIFEN